MGRPRGASARSPLTMTIEDVCKLFRSYGIPAESMRMSDDIASGIYPFGRVVKVSPTGRRTFEIWRVDVEAFLKTKMPEGYQEVTQ